MAATYQPIRTVVRRHPTAADAQRPSVPQPDHHRRQFHTRTPLRHRRLESRSTPRSATTDRPPPTWVASKPPGAPDAPPPPVRPEPPRPTSAELRASSLSRRNSVPPHRTRVDPEVRTWRRPTGSTRTSRRWLGPSRLRGAREPESWWSGRGRSRCHWGGRRRGSLQGESQSMVCVLVQVRCNRCDRVKMDSRRWVVNCGQ